MAQYGAVHLELGVRSLAALSANFHAADLIMAEQMRMEVAQTARDVGDLTSLLSPKDTTFMSQHVHEWFTPSGLGFEVGWDVMDFVENGLAFYPYFQEFGTRYMAAQPSLGPAFDHIAPEFQRRISAIIATSIARLGGRQA
jgi:HK97 gp10 family phage protein